SIPASALTDLLGAKMLARRPDEDLDIYVARIKRVVGKKWERRDGKRAKMQRRIFYMILLTRMLFATKNSKVSLRYMAVLENMKRVRKYAWGAATLAELYHNLSTPTSSTGGVGGFTPLLQVRHET